MKPEKQNDIESLVSKTFDNFTATPSGNVLRNIRFKLWLSDFFRPAFNTFNFYYLVAVTGGVLLITTQVSDTNINSTSEEITQPEIITNNQSNPAYPISDSLTDSKNENPVELPLVTSAAFSISARKGCAPLELVFKNKSVNASKISWSISDGTTSTRNEFKHTFTKPGQYKVKLTATDEFGKNYISEEFVRVFDRPVAIMAIDIENSNQETKTVVFKNNSQNSAHYIWSFGDNTLSEEPVAIHTYEKYGTYQVKLIAYSAAGCSDTTVFVNRFIDQDYRLIFPPSFRANVNMPPNNGNYESLQNKPFVFYPENKGVLKYELKIKAPNGLEVFSTSNIKVGWNGYIGGNPAPSGNYFYSAKGIYPNNKPFEIEGVVRLIAEDFN